MSVVTARDAQANHIHYQAATQTKQGGPIILRDIVCENDDEMRSFLLRISEVQRFSDFAFCEVHRFDRKTNTTAVVIGNANMDFPQGVPIHHSKHIYSPTPIAPPAERQPPVRRVVTTAHNSDAMPIKEPVAVPYTKTANYA